MGCSSGKRRTWGSTERSIARTSYRWKAPRIVSTPKPFTGFGCTRSRPERTPRDRLRGRCEGAGGRQRCQRLDRIGVDHGEIRRGEETPRRTVSDLAEASEDVVKRPLLQFPLVDASRWDQEAENRERGCRSSGGSGGRSRSDVSRWCNEKPLRSLSLKEVFRAC